MTDPIKRCVEIQQMNTFVQRHHKAVYWSLLAGRTAGLIALVLLGGYLVLAIGALLTFISFYEGLTFKERTDAEIDEALK